MSEFKDIRKPKPIICKHQLFIWPWAAKMSAFVAEYLCKRCK